MIGEAKAFDSVNDLMDHYGRLYGTGGVSSLVAMRRSRPTPQPRPVPAVPPPALPTTAPRARPVRRAIVMDGPGPVDFLHGSRLHFIASYVAAKHGLTVEQLFLPTHRREISRPRQEAMASMLAHTGKTVAEVGRFFGMDRTTAAHAAREHFLRAPQLKAIRERALADTACQLERFDLAVAARSRDGLTPTLIAGNLGVDVGDVHASLARTRRGHRIVQEGRV